MSSFAVFSCEDGQIYLDFVPAPDGDEAVGKVQAARGEGCHVDRDAVPLADFAAMALRHASHSPEEAVRDWRELLGSLSRTECSECEAVVEPEGVNAAGVCWDCAEGEETECAPRSAGPPPMKWT